MKYLLAILILSLSANSFQQRPDLSIGYNAKLKFLNSDSISSNFIAPGADLQLHVSKRSLLGGINLGYLSTIEGSIVGFSPKHLINIDGVLGWVFLRKPSIKVGLNAVCSYSVVLNKRNQLYPSSVFYRNSLAILPELYCNYKFIRFGINYNLPIAGSKLCGIGVEVGVRF